MNPRQKRFLGFLLITVMPLWLTCFLGLSHASRLLSETAKRKLETLSLNQEALSRQFLSDTQLRIRSFLTESLCRDLKNYLAMPDIAARQKIRAAFGTLRSVMPDIEEISVIDSKMIIRLSSHPARENQRWVDAPIVVRGGSGTDVSISWDDSEVLHFYAFANVRSGQSDVGIFAVKMKPGRYFDLFLNAEKEWGESESQLVLFQTENTVTIIEKSKTGKEGWRRRTLSLRNAGPLITGLTDIGRSRILPDTFNERGEHVFALLLTLPEIAGGWIVSFPRRVIFNALGGMQKTMLAVAAAASGFLILAGLWVLRPAKLPWDPDRKKQEAPGSEPVQDKRTGPLSSTDQQDRAALLAAHDELRKEEESLARVRESLEIQKQDIRQMNSQLDGFVSAAGHDLRPPLRGILSFAQRLKNDYGERLDVQANDFLNEIIGRAVKMDDYVEDLIRLARISQVRNPIKKTAIGPLVEGVISRYAHSIEQSQARLSVAKDLPVMLCDAINITEVFSNLISNAIKFSNRDQTGRLPEIEIKYYEEDQAHHFIVADNGIGIDPREQDQIFGLFKRLQSAGNFGGTGAGLSIVKRIVEEHQGRVWVKSETGKGAEFHFTIPMHPVSQ